MHIGGFQKNTLIDFPGTLSCLVFTQGCNFSCPYCHNPGLIAGGETTIGHGQGWTTGSIFRFLEKRRGLLDGVAVTGGEPCLQHDLDLFCRTVKDMGFKVKLDTNGSRPQILQSLLDENLVDYIAMDIKTSLPNYHRVWRTLSKDGAQNGVKVIQQSIELIMEKAPGYEFRTTCASPFITPEIMADIGEMIQGAQLYHLQACTRHTGVLDPDFAQNPDHFYTSTHLERFRCIAQSFVETCRIR
ncbi:MAG: anaerobic ribonucleoside-triphosphate reductase activating protein [Desulfobacteraceae bacterium]|nr:MAG: anaerobic ribonucleoside-triphosphate reductase activating protein [Desulfobacteraceae bacterium]